MKLKSIVTFSVACLLTSSALASTKTTSASQTSVDQKIQELEKQIHELQNQINAQQPETVTTTTKTTKQSSSKNTSSGKANKTTTTTTEVDVTDKQKFGYYYAPFVFASPYLSGARSAYDASDLITNWPSVNEDLFILKSQIKYTKDLEAAGLPYSDRPLIAISGYVEGRIYGQDDYNNPNVKSDVDLSGVELDILAQMAPWVSAYMALAYDDVVENIYLSRAFLTVGNLEKFPVYGTIGKIYVPFGTYSSDMIADPVTKLLAKTKDEALEIGFYKNGVYGSVYTFRGDSYEGDNTEIENGGVNLGYGFKNDKISIDFGAGYIYNMADSQGMQSTGNNNSSFEGFGTNDSTEKLDHPVAGGDVHASFNYNLKYGSLGLLAEYISALDSFDQKDMTFNSQGAQPAALNVEAVYRFEIMEKPTFIAATYGQSWEALALNIPEYSYVGTFGISLWKSTVEKFEFRHELNYGSGDTASGSGYAVAPSDRRDRNIGMLQIDVYF